MYLPRLAFLFLILSFPAAAQSLKQLVWRVPTYEVTALDLTDGRQTPQRMPLLSLEINQNSFSTNQADSKSVIDGRLQVTALADPAGMPGVRVKITFRNVSGDTLRLGNVVPFGVATPGSPSVYITGLGNHPLSRTHIFRPGQKPVNCIVPDNAWELGFASIERPGGQNLCALTRRDRETIKSGLRRRFETVLYPKTGEVTYYLYADLYQGDWQEGLRRMFQERHLYDLPSFDNTLFERPDLKWIRNSYVMHLIMNWNHIYYDGETRTFGLTDFLTKGKSLYGGDDVIGLWPTWPTLGLDQRNQFDLFRDLPGGMPRLRQQQAMMNSRFGTRLFICYNPWDESTRTEGHLNGLEKLLRETGADGVVLDTKGESSRELQQAADKVKPGIIMYSEGMAIPKDMPGIVSGRVHNALYYPPLLNLNKFIKPEFAIFRVAEVNRERIRREFALSFFNGHGTELNLFGPGLPDWLDEQYRYLGQTTRLLREHTTSFTGGKLTPLVPTLTDNVYVNRWELPDKILFTVFSLLPEGYTDALFAIESKAGWHAVDLWHHEELKPVQRTGKTYLPARLDAFEKANLGTNNEGAVTGIALFRERLQVELDNDKLMVVIDKATEPVRFADNRTEVRIWAGLPAYDKKPLVLTMSRSNIQLLDHFGRFEGKFVVQLVENNLVQDERIVMIPAGTPRLVHTDNVSPALAKIPRLKASTKRMVNIPAGAFTFKATNGDEFIGYPKHNTGRTYNMPAYWMDKHPVTNAQFKAFLDATKYRPAEPANFLKHWKGNVPPKGQEHYPVVYVSYEDAQAYAHWAGKRLPTELEWQYAAQTTDGREWPWARETTGIRREVEPVNETLSVTRIKGIDAKYCNLGNGQPDPVGKYPAGANPLGLEDLVGCVWQLTSDQYVSGSYRYVIMKGGSYFSPSSSWWYVQSGPRELHYRQYLLRVSPGFERNATVGFRCVKE